MPKFASLDHYERFMTDGVGNPNAHYKTEGVGGEVYLSDEKQRETQSRVSQLSASKHEELALALIAFSNATRNPYYTPSLN